MTPYMCTKCGKAHASPMEAKNCDHKKEEPKKQVKKPTPKTTTTKVEEK